VADELIPAKATILKAVSIVATETSTGL